MSDVFVSYSRRDKPAVQQLHDALADRGKDVWIDWHDIPKAVDFLDEIYRAIEGADSVLIAISPDSSASGICDQELQHAMKHRKRLIPVVLRDVNASDLPGDVAALNWIFLRDEDDFDEGIDHIVEVMETNHEWVHQHTRLLTRAVQWEASGKDGSLLLRGDHLVEVEQCLGQVKEDDTPRPTALQREYIAASRLNASRFWRNVLVSISGAFVAVLVLAIVALFQKFKADDNAAEAALQADRYARSAFGLQLRRVRDDLDRRKFGEAQLLLNDDAKCLPFLRSFVWGYYHDQSRRERRRLVEHDSAVNAISRSPDGRLLASSSDDHTVRIWPLPDLENPQVLAGHEDEIWSVEFSPTSPKMLASGSKDGCTYLWDLDAPDTPREISRRSGESVAVTNVCFHPTDARVAVSHEDGLVRLIDVVTGSLAAEAQVDCRVHDLVWSPDGTRLVAGCEDGTIGFWNSELSDHRRMALHEGDIRSVAFLAEPHELATGGTDGRIRIWRDVTNEVEQSDPPKPEHIIESRGTVYCIRATRDRLVWGSSTGQIGVWQRRLRQIEIELQTKTDGDLVNRAVYGVCVPDAEVGILSATHDGTIREWQIDDPSPVLSVAPPGEEMSRLRMNALGTVAAMATGEAEAVWRPLSGPGEALRVLERPGLTPSDGDDIEAMLARMNSQPFGFAISDDGSMIAPIFQNTTDINVYSTGEAETSHEITGHQSELSAAAFSPDSTLFASVDNAGFLQVHRTTDWDQCGSRDLQQAAFHMAFSSDGDMLFVSLADGSVGALDTRTRELDWQLQIAAVPEKGSVNDLAIDETGQRLCVVVDGSVYAASCSTQAASVLTLLTSADTTAIQVCCSPDGRIVATGHTNGSVQLWDAETGDLRGLIRADAVRSSDEKAVQVADVFFHPTRRRLFVIHRNGVVTVHDATAPDVWFPVAESPTK